MNGPRPARQARRLFDSVRRERPSAALRQRILAAGRAEYASHGIESDRRAIERQGIDRERHGIDRERERRPRQRFGIAALAAAAAAAAIVSLVLTRPRGDVLISAEQAGAGAASRESGERAGLPPRTPAAATPAASTPAAATSAAATPAATTPPPVVTGGASQPEPARATDEARAGEAPTSAPPASTRGAARAQRRAGAADRRSPLDASSAASVATAAPSVAAPPAPAQLDPVAREVQRPTLGRQLEQIKQARAALRAGDAPRALQLLDAYRAQPGSTDLAAEASLLRIEALAASGQREAASRAARQFASDHPNSPLIDRALGYASSPTER